MGGGASSAKKKKKYEALGDAAVEPSPPTTPKPPDSAPPAVKDPGAAPKNSLSKDGTPIAREAFTENSGPRSSISTDPEDDEEEIEVDVADWIVQTLVDCGVTHIFGGHGGAIVPLINAICAHEKLTWVYTRCELNASIAAAAYAKLKDGLGCCIGTSGPGASHLTTGLLDAELDKCPVLCITGMKNSDKVGFSDFQDIGQTELFKAAGITSSVNVMNKNAVVPLLRDSIASAITKRSCSHLAVPFDIQRQKITIPSELITEEVYMGRLTECASPDDIEACAEYLMSIRAEGHRVLIAVGHRGVHAGPWIVKLAEKLGVPIVTTLDAKGCVPEDHRNLVGVFGIFGNPGMEASAALVQTSDLVISIGVDEHSQLIMSAKGIQERRMVEIDISTTVLEMRCQAVFSLVGNVSHSCEELVNEMSKRLVHKTVSSLSQQPFVGERKITRKLSKLGGISWGAAETISQTGFDASHLTQRPSTYTVPEDEITAGYCHPGRVLQMLGPMLSENTVVCIDVGDCTLWAGLCLCLSKKGQRMLASIRLGTMGYSICAAMAAGALQPDSHVVAIAGDGGVQMATNELATLKQLRIRKLLIIVFVNTKLGRVANEIWGPLGSQPAAGCEIESPDFCLLAKAHGGTGIRVADSSPAVLSKALEKALACNGLCLLEVIQDPAVKPLMAKRCANRTPASAMNKHQNHKEDTLSTTNNSQGFKDALKNAALQAEAIKETRRRKSEEEQRLEYSEHTDVEVIAAS